LLCCKNIKLQNSKPLSFIYFYCSQISNENCLVETTIFMDMMLYLSLYYLVNDLVHLPKSDHQVFDAVVGDCWYFRRSDLNYLFISVIYFFVFKYSKNTKKIYISIDYVLLRTICSLFHAWYQNMYSSIQYRHRKNWTSTSENSPNCKRKDISKGNHPNLRLFIWRVRNGIRKSPHNSRRHW
jgi:hypothetical protein